MPLLPPEHEPNYYSGYWRRFKDLQDLVSEPEAQDDTRRLLHRWFGHEIHGSGECTAVTTAGGKPVDLYELHLRIQADLSKQNQLYNLFLTLWH